MSLLMLILDILSSIESVQSVWPLMKHWNMLCMKLVPSNLYVSTHRRTVIWYEYCQKQESITIGVFHGVAGVARATPVMELMSASRILIQYPDDYYFSFDFNYWPRLYLLAWLHWAGQDGQPDGSETNSLTAKIKITHFAMTFWSGLTVQDRSQLPLQSVWYGCGS